MNAKAQEGLRILKQKAAKGELTPLTDAETPLFADLLDFINNPGKSNATALLDKLRHEAGYAHEITEDLEGWEKATRQVFSILLAPHEDDDGFSHGHIKAIYDAITEEVES
jgi:hypothetical protein